MSKEKESQELLEKFDKAAEEFYIKEKERFEAIARKDCVKPIWVAAFQKHAEESIKRPRLLALEAMHKYMYKQK